MPTWFSTTIWRLLFFNVNPFNSTPNPLDNIRLSAFVNITINSCFGGVNMDGSWRNQTVDVFLYKQSLSSYLINTPKLIMFWFQLQYFFRFFQAFLARRSIRRLSIVLTMSVLDGIIALLVFVLVLLLMFSPTSVPLVKGRSMNGINSWLWRKREADLYCKWNTH